MSFLSLSHIAKTFGTTTAVEDFNLSVEPGEFVSFLGPSGCGKTTTLRMIAGFELPSAGTITIAGEDITHKPPNQRNIGMVFQSYALFPNMSVADNIGFGLKVTRKPASQIKQTVAEMLDVIQLPDVGSRYPHQLSGGQQQRVALARALAIRPQVLLLDEPLSALDAKIRVELRNEIRRIQRQLAITTIYVTHDQEEALSLSDRIVVMNAGRVEQIGAPFAIYNYPATAFTASFIGQLNLAPVRVVDPIAGTCLLGGQPVQVTPPLEAPAGAAARLAIRPEELTLRPLDEPRQPEINHLRGRVETVLFLGSIVRVRVAIEPGDAARDEAVTLAVDLFNERLLAIPQPGETVQVVFAPHACWMVREP
jgi:putative spermidine/putrescine transport system ATP-binding protein